MTKSYRPQLSDNVFGKSNTIATLSTYLVYGDFPVRRIDIDSYSYKRIILEYDLANEVNVPTEEVSPTSGYNVALYSPRSAMALESYGYTKDGDIDKAFKVLNTIIGNKSELTTNIKTSVVNAVNWLMYIANERGTGVNSHAEGFETNATNDNSHAEGYQTSAYGKYSHAEGQFTVANTTCAHAEGYNTQASKRYSHSQGRNTMASGECSHAEGFNTTSSGDYSHAEGNGTIAASYHSHAQNVGTIARYAQTAIGRYNIDSANNSYDVNKEAFVIGNGTSTGERGNAFKVMFSGQVYADNSYYGTGADYSEYFEWYDDNPDNEDRVGYFVTLNGIKIEKAGKSSDYILGITSAIPTIIGDNYSDRWKGKYITDVFERVVFEEVVIPPIIDDDGNIIEAEKTELRQILNPLWDETKQYIPRENRPEWSTVGTMGKIIIRDDGTCKANGYCKPSDGGIATASNKGYRVLERINDTLVKVWVR